MVNWITQPMDFIVFNLYFIFGFNDMFLQPELAGESGILQFMVIYALILLLFGIPAFAEETSSSMETEDGVNQHSSTGRSWSFGHQVIVLMQNSQMTVSMSYDILKIVIMQIIALVDNEAYENLFPKQATSTNDFGVTGKASTEPSMHSCSLEAGDLSCDIPEMATSKSNELFYSTIVLSTVFLVYAMTFGRSLRTYCTVGRLYLALVVLFITVLLLHFIGASTELTQHLTSHLTDLSLYWGRNVLQTKAMQMGLDSCIYSLGLCSFGVIIIGSWAGGPIKRRFVCLAVAICFADFGLSLAFFAVNVLRECVVSAHHSKMNMTYDILRLKSALTRSIDFPITLRQNIYKIVKSVMLFHETSGCVPWTVYLPIQIMLLIFATLLICNYFLLTDLHAINLFKRRHNGFIIAASALRFGLLILVFLVIFTERFKELASLMKLSVSLSFLVMKMIECVTIHLNVGFTEYLRRKRGLIPECNYIQTFTYNWYIAPAILYLFNVGYPLALTIYVLNYHKSLMTMKFCAYFLGANALPALIIVTLEHILTDDQSTKQSGSKKQFVS